jgi:hypothetical protein
MVHQPREERLAKQRKYYETHKQQYKEYGHKYYKNNKEYFKEYYQSFYNTPKDYNGVAMTYAQNYYLTNKQYLNEYQRAYNAKKRNQIKPPEPKLPISKAETPPVPKVTSKLIRKRIEIELHLKQLKEKSEAFKESLLVSG